MFRGANDLILPREFAGPAQLILYTRYDDPRDPGWQNKWIHTWHVQKLHPWFPVKEIKVHKHFWPLLDAAFFELERKGLHREIKTFDACLQIIHLPDSPVLSVHSWGVAIDMNAADNPRGSLGGWSKDFLDVMAKNGIFCGQTWRGVTEPMHFSMVDG